MAKTVGARRKPPLKTRAAKWLLQFVILLLCAVAAWISYGHQVFVVLATHESSLNAHLYPLLGDAPMLAATILVYQDRRARLRPRRWALVVMGGGLAFSTGMNLMDAVMHHGDWLAIVVATFPAVALYGTSEMLAHSGVPLPKTARRRRPARKTATKTATKPVAQETPRGALSLATA